MQVRPDQFSKNAENSTASIQPPTLGDYMDYRMYLRDFYRFKRKLTKTDLRPYSYQNFSAAANIRSPNYLKMIIEGRRNLSDDMVLKFAKACGLNKEHSEEFHALVRFTQSTEPADRNVWLKKLSELRVTQKIKTGEIDKKTWEKIPNWVAWIVYAMVDQDGVKFDTKTLRRLLRNKASEDEIELALNSLINSGELLRDEATGELKKAHTLIESPEDVPVALVRKLQAQLMYLGLESLYQDAATEREFGSVTLSMTRAEFEELKFKLRQFKKNLHKDNSIARGNSKGEKVYQLNIQLFPVTEAVNESEATARERKSALSQLIAKASTQAPAPTQTNTAATLNVGGLKDRRDVVNSLLEAASSAASLFDDAE